MTVFSEKDQRLSAVPRWVILRTIQRQNVATHCFNVERIARRIAIEWINEDVNCDAVSQYALHHDDDEALTGDIPSTAKDYIQVSMVDNYHQWTNGNEEVKRIVKLADLLEAVWFLLMEEKMGNSYITKHTAACRNKVMNYAEKYFGSEIADKCIGLMARWTNEESQRI